MRETLDFSRTCLGVGSGEQTLREISRKEKEAGIVPDREIEAFMRGTMTREERQTLLTTNFVLPCADMAASTSLPALRDRSVVVKRGQNPNIGVEAAVSKHWGEKRTKPKHWGFPDYYPFYFLLLFLLFFFTFSSLSLAVAASLDGSFVFVLGLFSAGAFSTGFFSSAGFSAAGFFSAKGYIMPSKFSVLDQ